jgi:hypothetical protein
MKVYDLEGDEHDKDSVDVAECIRLLGWTAEPPAPKTDESIGSESTGSSESTSSESTSSENAKAGSKKKGSSTGEQTPPVTE